MSPAAERILGLCKSIFRVDSVLLHLRDGDTVFARPGDAAFGEQQRRTACNKLAPPDDKAAVCEDPEGDARQVPSFSALLKPQGCALSGLLGVFMTRAECAKALCLRSSEKRPFILVLQVEGPLNLHSIKGMTVCQMCKRASQQGR